MLWLELSGEESLSLWNAHLSKVCSCQVSTAPRDCISKTRANIVSFHMHELESDHPLHQSAISHVRSSSSTFKNIETFYEKLGLSFCDIIIDPEPRTF